MIQKSIPKEALTALQRIEQTLGNAVVAVYLYGSAVSGGLRKDSDVDLLVILDQPMSKDDRGLLGERLLAESGRVGNADGIRPLEVTVLSRKEVVPWKYPPRKEFIYGEWLRGAYEQGQIPEPAENPDLAIILSQVRQSSIALTGEAADRILALVPVADVRRAMKDSLPDLITHLRGDERNVILTLARMWVTATTGKFLAKDEAAQWVIPLLPKEQAALVDVAAKAYRGECIDDWENLDFELTALVVRLKQEIESRLG